jgi:hypothetical protein
MELPLLQKRKSLQRFRLSPPILQPLTPKALLLRKSQISRGGMAKRDQITKAKGGEGKRQMATKGKGRTKMATKNQRKPTLFAPGLRTPLIFQKMEIV